jgi:putative transposase
MGRRRKQVKPLPTIWRVPDALWEKVEPVLAELDPPKATGRPRIDARAALDAIIYRMRTGCQWNQLPKEFPDDSSVHRTFQRWQQRGVLARLWQVLVEDGDQLGGVDWQWQAADGAMGKARFGGTRLGRTPRIAAKTG